MAASSSMLIKKSKNIAGSGNTESVFFAMCVAVYSIVLLFFINKFQITLYPFNYLFASLYAVIGIISTVLSLKAFSYGKVSAYLMMTSTGSVLIPYLVGILWLNESFSFVKTIGIVLMCVAFVIKNTTSPKKVSVTKDRAEETAPQKEGGTKANKLFLIFCLAGAVIAGGGSVAISLNSMLVPQTDNISFSFITQIFVLFLTGAYLLIRWKTTKKTFLENRKMTGILNLGVALIYAVICGGSLIFSLELAKRLPTSFVFPITSSGNIVLVTVLDSLFYKEKFTLRDLISTLLIVVAIVLVSLNVA